MIGQNGFLKYQLYLFQKNNNNKFVHYIKREKMYQVYESKRDEKLP